ncbi:hypothetical protein CRG98_030627 [Punica granatum]|uniref:Uncharacterized protein n=1 Tax=Punica granatum TaxID=22663 RepID=A0A2I0IZD6_PUNGR|nr:hypothetical protein CRG98_030627 [Punica granatum]
MRDRNSKAVNAGRSPKAINAGSKPDVGLKPESNKCWAEAQCGAKVDRPSGHGLSCRGGRVKTAGGLLAKVGTTRLSCGVGGRDERLLVIARLTMEK